MSCSMNFIMRLNGGLFNFSKQFTNLTIFVMFHEFYNKVKWRKAVYNLTIFVMFHEFYKKVK